MTDYEPVETDDGLEIRNDAGDVIWGPSQQYSYPPNAEMMDVVFDDANISQPTRAALKFAFGLVDVKNEKTDAETQ